MLVREKAITIPTHSGTDIVEHFKASLEFHLKANETPIRFAVTESDTHQYHCEIGVIEDGPADFRQRENDLFNLRKRKLEKVDSFNVALLVPTGIGSEIGGHAGDATPVARLLSEVCDTLITHPNVVNASDINEMSDDTLYVEGSILSRLLMGTIGLQKVRSNRVLVVIDDHKDELFVNAAINAVSAARASFGFNCPKVIKLNPPVKMSADFTDSGRAAGDIENLDYLCEVLEEYRDEYDAVAISSVIKVPEEFHQGYFDSAGEMVNPWGGVEAMLTHAISSIFNVPSAHSPMFETQKIANTDPGVVDPRMAAEAVSLTFLQCIFKGLQRSPKIITDQESMKHPAVLTASDISCMVIPDGCLGLPTLAALEQGISVIAVKENKNLMKNDLTRLPWKPGQLYIVENYWEAAGVLIALRAGITPDSVRRPFSFTATETCTRNKEIKKQVSAE